MTSGAIEAIRASIPALAGAPEGWCYLDSAATTLTPQPVLDAWRQVYSETPAAPAARASQLLEAARERLKRFYGVPRDAELIFCRNATDALNAAAIGLTPRIQAGDTIAVPEHEHASNFLPWQRLAAQQKAALQVLPINAKGSLALEELATALNAGPRLLALSHTGNVSGYQPNLGSLARPVRERGGVVVLDAAQAAAHHPLNFETAGADLLAISAHKAFGPKGIGALIGRRETLEALEPARLGGGMEAAFTASGFELLPLPARLEAGTQDIAGAVAWAAAADWLETIGWDFIRAHEAALGQILREGLERLPRVQLVPGGETSSPAIHAFTVDGIAANDVAARLAQKGIHIRAGHCSAHLLMQRLGVQAVCRASLAAYTHPREVEQFLTLMGHL